MNKKINIIPSISDLKNFIGKELGVSSWFEVTQDIINDFANVTNDHQWIHIDKNRAKKESPFGKTIAHGYYTLSLLPMFVSEIWKCKNTSLVLNYGSDKVRFISPVVCDSKIRAKIILLSLEEYKEGVKIKTKVDIEIMNSKKLALSAETLSILL